VGAKVEKFWKSCGAASCCGTVELWLVMVEGLVRGRLFRGYCREYVRVSRGLAREVISREIDILGRAGMQVRR